MSDADSLIAKLIELGCSFLSPQEEEQFHRLEQVRPPRPTEGPPPPEFERTLAGNRERRERQQRKTHALRRFCGEWLLAYREEAVHIDKLRPLGSHPNLWLYYPDLCDLRSVLEDYEGRGVFAQMDGAAGTTVSIRAAGEKLWRLEIV